MAAEQISFNDFNILQSLVLNPNIRLRYLCKNLATSNTEQIKKVLKSLAHKGLVRPSSQLYEVTKKGMDALEPYRVKRAVILAAGMGQRMRPVTLSTPKPMVRIGNKRIIETQIHALLAAGITDITIVRGYLGDIFDELLIDYPMLQFVHNPYWESKGAIVSVNHVIDRIEGAYVIEGDLLVKNPAIIRPYEYHSSYCGIPGDVSDDWYFCTDNNHSITELDFGTVKGGDKRAYKFVGIMYWAPDHGKTLRDDLKLFMQDSANHHGFIEAVPFKEQTSDYNIRVRRVRIDDVTEVDTHDELQALRNEAYREKASTDFIDRE